MTDESREPAIDLLDVVWSSIDDLGAGLDEAQWKTPSELPGWSVQDNLSHIIGTELMMRGEPTPDNEPARTDHLHNPIGEMNEHWVEHYRGWSGADLLDEFRRVSSARLAELRAMPPERFDEVGPTPVGEAPYREFLAVRVFDSWIHEQDMRRALGRPGHRSGPAVELSLGRMVSAMPFVVGKKVGAPDGTSVVLVVEPADSDGAVLVIPVEVAGRASVAASPPDAPTARIVLGIDAFVALSTGRWDPQESIRRSDASFDGDDALGRSVVEQLNFMV
jgi:uncharacterized protein (TIGR03083 family)